jgi:serine/threonine kinase 16
LQGGFSYVYLVQDTATSELLALKKIRCPFGAESVAQATREVEAYALFAHVPSIIPCVDHSIQDDQGSKVSGIGDAGGGASKTVYILLPYYRRGNLQDAINANLINHTRFPERDLVELMLGVARALKGMHHYRMPGAKQRQGKRAGPASKGKARAGRGDVPGRKPGRSAMVAEPHRQEDREEDEEEEDLPLMAGEVTQAQEGVEEGELRGYAHRDIKPGKYSHPPPSNLQALRHPS